MKRRDFLKFGSAALAGSAMGASGLMAWIPRAHAATINKTFYITHGTITQADGVGVYFRGFSGSRSSLNVPGEQMIVQQGDTVNITIVNTLSTSHSLVIDGISDATVNTGRIRGGRSASVSFSADNTGTFLYYDAQNAPYNRLIGLHGGIAVMPKGSSNELYPGSPTFNNPKGQYFWIFNDIDPAWNNAIRNGQTPGSNYVPRYFSLNGLTGRPPGAPDAMNPAVDSMADPRSKLDGHLGDRTLVRCLNAGRAQHAVHLHGNHMEWLSKNGQNLADVWEKDIIALDGNGGGMDFIFPFAPPPDAWPPVTNNTLVQAENEGRHFAFPMHLHDEMTQTAGGGLYMFGALTDVYYHAD